MFPLRAILCPVDFSEQSRHALRVAGALAALSKSRLIVLSVLDPLLAEAATVRLGLDLQRLETEPALGDFVKETWPGQPAQGAGPELSVQVGEAAARILEAAAGNDVGLIVMGTQGLGGFRKWLLGSTTERVLRHTQTPVLAVPPAEASSPHAADTPFDAGPVLAATDFSESSMAAVRRAAQFAQQLAVPLLLVNVVEPVPSAPQWSAYVEQSNDERVTDARAHLSQLAEQLGSATAPQLIVALGRPADAIAQVAEQRKAALIVMGLTSDHAPFARRPGSIAYRVLGSAHVPVLVVPPGA